MRLRNHPLIEEEGYDTTCTTYNTTPQRSDTCDSHRPIRTEEASAMLL